jgi:hypothetical protein
VHQQSPRIGIPKVTTDGLFQSAQVSVEQWSSTGNR